MGGNFCQKDNRLRVQRDKQRGAKGAFSLLHQSARTCRLLQRNHRLPHGGGRGCGSSAQERDTAPHTAYARPRVFHQATDGICEDGRRHAVGQATFVGNGGEGENAYRHRLRTEDGFGYAHDRPQLRRSPRQQGEPLRQNDSGVLPQIRCAQRNAVRLLGFGDIPAGRRVERVQRDKAETDGGLRHTGKRGALHSGVQDGQVSQSSDRRHERRDGACIVRFHLYARNWRECAEKMCRHPSFGYTVATV